MKTVKPAKIIGLLCIAMILASLLTACGTTSFDTVRDGDDQTKLEVQDPDCGGDELDTQYNSDTDYETLPAVSIDTETPVPFDTDTGNSDKRNETLIEIKPLCVPAYGVNFRLPSGWTYKTTQDDSEQTSMTVGIMPETAGVEGNICLYCSNGVFGVCGTGLKTETIVFNGHEATQGFYDGSSLWDFICLKDFNGCAIINSAKNWYAEYSDEIDQILSSVEFVFYGLEETLYSLADGRYILEQSKEDTVSAPYLLIYDGNLTVIQNMAQSYQPRGPIVIDGNDIVMETEFANEPCKWTFKLLSERTLVFSSGASVVPSGWDNWADGMRFVLAEEFTTATSNDFSYHIEYELGDTFSVFTDMPSEAFPGDIVEIRTGILLDAGIHVYVDGQEISMAHYDSNYWGYSFVMPDKDVLVTAKFYTKDEIWGAMSVDESVLREKYPEYFDLSTFKGLEVYVWQMAHNSYYCGVMEGTNRNKELEELMSLKGTTIDEMKAILSSYDIPKENIFIIPWQNPFSSYLSDYWIIEENEDPDVVSERRQEYIDRLREMLLGNEATGFYGSELRIRINGQVVTYERYEAGNSSLTPTTLLDTFSEETEIEGIVWEVYSAEEYPDLSYVLVISGTNACWTYRIADNAVPGNGNKVDYANLTEVCKVAYANWTDNNRIYSSCLNTEKLVLSSALHFPVYKLDTKEDLELFREEFKDILTFDYGYNEILSFNEAVSYYDSSFFAEHSLILAYITASSGSFRFDIQDVIRNDSSLCVNVVQTNHPEDFTDDMTGWLIIAEVLDKELKGITDYDAILVTEANELPKDFTFSIVWGCYGISSYNSKTGELIKTIDTADVSKYTCYVTLSEDQMREVYRILFNDIDLFTYPDLYDPFNAPDAEIRMASEPNQTIIISATANGLTKTVACNNIAFGTLDDCYCEEAKALMNAENEIVELLTSLPEWAAFPEYEFFYD